MELSAAFRIVVIIMYSSQKTLPIRLTLPVSSRINSLFLGSEVEKAKKEQWKNKQNSSY